MKTERDDAFREFVRSVSPQLLFYAWLLCGDRQLAEDVVQEALISVYQRWDKIRTDPLAYTRRAVLNRYLSGRRRRRPQEVPLDGHDRAAYDTEPGDQRMSDLLGCLTERERAVVVLRYHLDLGERDIAELLGIAPGTVKSTASRALNRLRRALDQPNNREWQHERD